MKIRCYTLHDITATGITGRQQQYPDLEPQQYEIRRNQQRNLDTILQIIGMRCQPENITAVRDHDLDKTHQKWAGKLASKNIKVWSFEFTVDYPRAFADEHSDLGSLLADCCDVPMIIGLNEHRKILPTLQPYQPDANIHFEILDENSDTTT